ncbi:peroxisomal sarcosine oxidase-like isoform X2 [Clytia hemisphaerica]
MTLDSFPIWRDLEQQTGERLYINNGCIQVFDEHLEQEELQNAQRICEELKVPHEILTAGEVNERYKPFHIQQHSKTLLDTFGGTLIASKCLTVLQRLFMKAGGVLKDGEQVKNIRPGKICTVSTNKGEYEAKAIVITPGSFASKILPKVGLNLPLQPIRTHLCFWKVLKEKEGTVESGFPSFMMDKYHVYGTACLEYPGLLKIGLHGGKQVTCDYPDIENPDFENQKRFIREQMKGVECKPSIVEPCLYTETPDQDFILDFHPKYSNIVIGAGFSGTGFKMAPITGKILANMALDQNHGYDISEFRMTRFENIIQTSSHL